MQRDSRFKSRRKKAGEIAESLRFRLAFGILTAETRRASRINSRFSFKNATFGKSGVIIVIKVDAARVCLPMGKIASGRVHGNQPRIKNVLAGKGALLNINPVRIYHGNDENFPP